MIRTKHLELEAQSEIEEPAWYNITTANSYPWNYNQMTALEWTVIVRIISSENEVIPVKVTLFSGTEVTEGWTINVQTLIPAKDRLDLFQFHPYTSLKATLIKSQSGKWTHFTPQLSLSLFSLSLLDSVFIRLPLLPASAALFQCYQTKWCITGAD